jgi:hypothetical protein
MGQSPYVATFHADSTGLDRFTAPKKCSRLHLSAWLSGPWDLPQFLSQQQSSNICWQTCYIGLLGTYLHHVISTFNTCLQGLTHQSLTNIGRGYHLVDLGFSHYYPRPSQLMILRLPLRVLPGLRLTIQSFSN